IWSALEPSMAVTCANIPSLRPLYTVAFGHFHNLITLSRTSKKTSTTGGRRGPWPISRSQLSDGMFSQLKDPGDDNKTFGHGVSIHGGRRGDGYGGEDDGEVIELPMRGIQVKTEVSISTEKLEYKDRLF
ncbi:MAG: hypothetical protein Q9209_003483, partial [Squamulea sp. 1 TL-2023]